MTCTNPKLGMKSGAQPKVHILLIYYGDNIKYSTKYIVLDHLANAPNIDMSLSLK